MPKKSTSRVEKLRKERKEKNHIRREYYATLEHHRELKKTLKKLQEGADRVAR